MNGDFFDFTEDERREWRESDLTRSYLRLLQRQGAVAIETLVSCMTANDTNGGAVATGQHLAYAEAVRIAERNR